MLALVFDICLEEPLLVGEPAAGDPNSLRSLDFIPGSTLRGALIEAFLRRRGLADPLADSETRNLFFEGGLTFLHAYLVDQRGHRTLPVPLSWFTPKDLPDPIYDFAAGAADVVEDVKQMAEPFCSLEARDDRTCAELVTPRKTVVVHINRGGSGVGSKTVFQYVSLAADQAFQAVVLAEKQRYLEIMADLLSEAKLRFGRSRSAGYGSVVVENLHNDDNWSEYQGNNPFSSLIIVTALSDILLRDENGAYTTNLDGVVGVHHQAAYVGTRIVGGFNRKWGLPLPQAIAIKAGSVYAYASSEALLAKLRELQQYGVGERREEGYGRIAVNWHGAQEVTRAVVGEETPLPEALKGGSAAIATRMAERLLRARLDGALVMAINRIDVISSPSPAQLAHLRVQARQAMTTGNLGLLVNYLQKMKRPAREQFNLARMGGGQFFSGQPLYGWLLDLVRRPETVWEILGVQRPGPAIGQQEAALTQALAIEYVVRLIDGLARKLSREKTSAGGERAGEPS